MDRFLCVNMDRVARPPPCHRHLWSVGNVKLLSEPHAQEVTEKNYLKLLVGCDTPGSSVNIKHKRQNQVMYASHAINCAPTQMRETSVRGKCFQSALDDDDFLRTDN